MHRGSVVVFVCVFFAPTEFANAAQLDRTTVPTRPNPREGLEAPAAPRAVLPALEIGEAGSDPAAPGGPSVIVRQIEFVGSTVFGDADFEPLRAKYGNRVLSFEELLSLRDEATLLYVNQGFLTSGASIGTLNDGVLTVELTEGALAEIRVADETRFDTDYLRQYLEEFGPLDPVNVFGVEERLQVLQADPHIERIDAQLLPGRRLGESVLYVQPHDVEPMSFLLQANNYLNPAVGSGQVLGAFDYLNVSGRGDDLHLGIRAAEGLVELAADYEFPINARDTRVALYAFGADSEIVTSPFDDLDIEAKTRTYGARLTHPLTRTLASRSALFVAGEWRESKTYLLGSGFSFVEGPDDGKVEVAVIRTGWQGSRRSADRVLAGRAQLSVGLDGLGSTSTPADASSSTAESDFIVFLGQLQWAQRIGFLDSQIITRLDAQLADGPLFGIEQMPIGGRWTVRGYRENTLIRDSGVIGSIEWRIPLGLPGVTRLEIGPFVDWSYSWNEDRDEIGPEDIGSVGLGVKWQPRPNIEFEAFWGHAFEDIDYPNDDDLQDNGFHLQMRWWNE